MMSYKLVQDYCKSIWRQKLKFKDVHTCTGPALSNYKIVALIVKQKQTNKKHFFSSFYSANSLRTSSDIVPVVISALTSPTDCLCQYWGQIYVDWEYQGGAGNTGGGAA